MFIPGAFQLIDIIGTFAFALSGAIIGVKKGFDIFGVFVVAYITAIGGGVIRDICITHPPPAGLISIEYMLVVVFAVFSISFLKKFILSFEKPAVFFDALGLGFFSAVGANKTYLLTGNIQLSIVMGCISAVGGGCIRDVITGRPPLIFTQELYASAAIIGAAIQLMGNRGLINAHAGSWLAILACTAIRMLAIKYQLKLPSIKDIGF